MTAMIEWKYPDGIELLIKWLIPLGEVSDERPNGATLPYRLVNRLGGPEDNLTDRGVYAVHTFAADKPTAQIEADKTHRRIKLLVGQFVGQHKVTLVDGDVYVDNVTTVEAPHWEQWTDDNSIHRFVATYRVDLRLVAA